MKSKIKTFENPTKGVIAIMRWNDKPAVGDSKKAYVSYIYSESNAEFDSDDTKHILPEVEKYAKLSGITMWSY